MISGRRSDTTYENTEYLKPGLISSVTAAPPTRCRRSSTTTFLPLRAARVQRHARAPRLRRQPRCQSHFVEARLQRRPIHLDADELPRRAARVLRLYRSASVELRLVE